MIRVKKTQVVYVNKGDNKIIITQVTCSTSTGPMTCSKAKSTTTPLAKLVSKHSHLIKLVRTHNTYQPLITLAFFGVKSQNPHSWEKNLSALKDLHLIKSMKTYNTYQLFITLAFLGVNGQSSYSWEKSLSTLKDFGDKSLYSCCRCQLQHQVTLWITN